MKRFIKRFTRVSPQASIILVLIGVITVAGAVLLFKRAEPKADAQVEPRAARLERVDGNVDVAQALNQQDNDQLNWKDATVNAPLTVGDRIFARDNSHAEIAFTGRNYARLNPNAALDVLSLADQRTQLALRSGSAVFDVGEITNGELFEVATPCGAVDFTQPGLYQVGFGDDGNPLVSVLNGLAQIVGPAGSAELSKGQVMTLSCNQAEAAAPAVVSRLAPDTAGNIVNDYYGYRYPKTYDGRYRNYDAYLNDPDYYDPYRQSVSYQYLAEDIPGLYDLDEYGDWQDVNGYGRCWAPRVEADWSPYRDGYWDVNEVWGPTWVASEPWGYAPYHYGRWAFVNQQRWVWVPEDCRTHGVYAPALVAFVPIQQTQVAWVPLGPGERYVPRYYDADFQPRYLASPQIVEQYVNGRRTYVNLNYTNAVTVVPVDAFTRRIDRTVIVATNPQWIRQAQPVGDAFAVANLRQVAIEQERMQRRAARREMQAGIFNRPVVTSVAPVLPPGRATVAQVMPYQTVPEKQKRNKLQIENNGQVAVAPRADGVPVAGPQAAQSAVAQQRDQRIAELKARLQQGDKSAKPELRELKRERREQPAAVQPQPPVTAKPQAQPQAAQSKEQRRLERQQQAAAQQAQAEQQRQQRRARKQEQHQPQAQQGQMNQQREQRRAQKQAARQPQAQQAAQQQQVEQRRQQKQQARQQQAQQEAARQAQANQQREQRRAQRQQQAQQQQQQQQRQAAAQSQIKAQRQAERQQRQQQAMQQQQQRAIQHQQHQPPANPGQPGKAERKRKPDQP